ncbi:MAG: coproporphyrinogen dehydrogenase HemZ [Eubacteriales bacterium]|nr:coproporphyrinogen dehydrogenase HemZ [Eubacteriales bacterium]
MVKITFFNHTEHAALREAVSLFSRQYQVLPADDKTAVKREEAGYLADLYCLADSYKQLTPSLELGLSQALSLEVLRGHKAGETVTVWSRIRLKDQIVWQQECQVLGSEARRELKRQAYLGLEELTGIHWPWGALTGIRPTQVALEVWEQSGGDLDTALEELVGFQRLTPEKARKALFCAKREAELLSRLPEDEYLVYVGVPFCPSRCAYCSFITQSALGQADRLHDYALALCQEIRSTFRSFPGKVSCLYFGGGTPTSLSEQDLALVLETLRRDLPLKDDAEICVEAGRADTLNSTKLRLLADFGTQRLCINPQTMQDKTLERIGRRHTVADVLRAMEEARRQGFDNINMDFILGLPGESGEEFVHNLHQAIGLGAESITLHSLAFKRSAYLEDMVRSESGPDLLLPDPELSQALQTAEELLEDRGYEAYYLYRQKQVRGGLENTGYALKGKECLYNVGMMSDRRSVIGLGSGASSKRFHHGRLLRLYNSKDLGDYQRRIEEISEKKRAFFQED